MSQSLQNAAQITNAQSFFHEAPKDVREQSNADRFGDHLTNGGRRDLLELVEQHLCLADAYEVGRTFAQ